MPVDFFAEMPDSTCWCCKTTERNLTPFSFNKSVSAIQSTFTNSYSYSDNRTTTTVTTTVTTMGGDYADQELSEFDKQKREIIKKKLQPDTYSDYCCCFAENFNCITYCLGFFFCYDDHVARFARYAKANGIRHRTENDVVLAFEFDLQGYTEHGDTKTTASFYNNFSLPLIDNVLHYSVFWDSYFGFGHVIKPQRSEEIKEVVAFIKANQTNCLSSDCLPMCWPCFCSYCLVDNINQRPENTKLFSYLRQKVREGIVQGAEIERSGYLNFVHFSTV